MYCIGCPRMGESTAGPSVCCMDRCDCERVYFAAPKLPFEEEREQPRNRQERRREKAHARRYRR